jgi:hypothetical protein
MKAHPKARMLTRFSPRHLAAANRRDYMRHVVIQGA